jgi:TonB family protein
VSSLLLMLALAAAPSPAACPPPAMPLPRFPIEVYKRGRPATAKVLARIDGCGRVVEVRLHTASGQPAVDETALKTVGTWVLGESQRAQVTGEWVRIPVSFAGSTTLHPVEPEWAKSHRRPDYLEDAQPLGFDTIADFLAAGAVREDPLFRPPYRPRKRADGQALSVAFKRDATDDTIYWLTTYARPAPVRGEDGGWEIGKATAVGLARYRLVEEDGEPVVRLGILCEDTAEHCAEMREFLFKGLPSAKPRRR